MRGTIPRETKWDIVVDLFFYREPEEVEKEEQVAKELGAAAAKPEVSLIMLFVCLFASVYATNVLTLPKTENVVIKNYGKANYC